MTKQKRIENLEAELKEAYETINTLRKEADENFKASPEYTRMQQDLKMYELSKWSDEQHIENGIRSDMRLLEQMRKLR